MNSSSNQTLLRLVITDDNELANPEASVITFQSVYYTLQEKTCCSALPLPCIKRARKEILSNINGIFKPGMNAIIGPTGSGKSSLLDILADRKDPQGLSGTLRINGQARTSDFKYRVGYVVQDDILSGTLTVRENLQFSANLRLPKTISRESKNVIVEQVIEQLGLEGCANSKVGTDFQRGISGGERKRTNIGMELVLSPSILFLDEPTTGLDSSTARIVMEYLHTLSRSDRTIIFSIHQPRYSIFKLFDTLFLVAAGQCVYHGPATSVLPYFSSIGLVCEEHDNPADFLLDVMQGDRSLSNTETTKIDQIHKENAHHLHDQYVKSDIYASVQQEIAQVSNAKITTKHSNQPTATKSRVSEIYFVAQRTLRNVYRNPALVGMQTVVTVILAVLIGLIYLQLDKTIDVGVSNRMGAIFFIITNQVMANLSAIELFIKERVLFIHENAGGYYHVSTFFIAKLICDLLPLRIIPSILFSVVVYFMMGFQATAANFFIFYLSIFLTTTCGAAICFFLSASVEVFGIANLLAAMYFVLTMVFGGFLVEVTSVIKVLSWIKWISLFRYSMNAIKINEFKGLKFCLSNNSSACEIDGLDVIRQYGIEYKTEWDLWKNFVALGAMIVVFFTLTYIQLIRIKKTK